MGKPKEKKPDSRTTERLEVLSLKDAVRELSKNVKEGKRKFTPIAVTYHKNAAAVILSAADWEALVRLERGFRERQARKDSLIVVPGR